MMNTRRDNVAYHLWAGFYTALLLSGTGKTAIPAIVGEGWEIIIVDLAMAILLIYLMWRTIVRTSSRTVCRAAKLSAWGIVTLVSIFSFFPDSKLSGDLTSALGYSLLVFAWGLYFWGFSVGIGCLLPALWCWVFMPYHAEFMLLASYPLRLSATMLSAEILQLCQINVVYSGSSLQLPSLDIAITDACSGINQLDAFLLIACIAVEIMQRNIIWKLFHFAFIIPCIIAGNTIRIVLTVLLYQLWGAVVLENTWHIALGYLQIIMVLVIFFVVGKAFNPNFRQTVKVKL